VDGLSAAVFESLMPLPLPLLAEYCCCCCCCCDDDGGNFVLATAAPLLLLLVLLVFEPYTRICRSASNMYSLIASSVPVPDLARQAWYFDFSACVAWVLNDAGASPDTACLCNAYSSSLSRLLGVDCGVHVFDMNSTLARNATDKSLPVLLCDVDDDDDTMVLFRSLAAPHC
jgi:hypothetical protein